MVWQKMIPTDCDYGRDSLFNWIYNRASGNTNALEAISMDRIYLFTSLGIHFKLSKLRATKTWRPQAASSAA
jgi:hypothetical protein